MVTVPADFYLKVVYDMLLPFLLVLLLLLLARLEFKKKSGRMPGMLRTPGRTVGTALCLGFIGVLLLSLCSSYYSKKGLPAVIGVLQDASTLKIEDSRLTVDGQRRDELVIDDIATIQSISAALSDSTYVREPSYGSLATIDVITISATKNGNKVGQIRVVCRNTVFTGDGFMTCRYRSSNEDLLTTLRNLVYAEESEIGPPV